MTLLEDVAKLTRETHEIRDELDVVRADVDRHEEQQNGKRGTSAAIDILSAEVRSLRRAAYVVAGIIVTASIGFAFSVLQLVGN